MPKAKGTRCPLCGKGHEEAVQGLAHILVGHGPLAGASPWKRGRARAALPRIHRRLEEAGFSEGQAHLILRLMAEEMRKLGAL